MKIKILVDAHIFDHSFQGTATYILGLYSALVEHDNFEIYLCAHDIENLKTIFINPKFKYIKLNSKSKFKRLIYELPLLIRREKFDYAHFQYVTPIVKTCKFINTIHDILFLDYTKYFPVSYIIKNYLLFRFSAFRSDVILTVSDFSKKQLINKFNLTSESIVVTPNAVPISISKNFVSDRPFGLDKYILFVSRFEPRKNHIGLLNSFVRLHLHDKGYKLVFVGTKKEQIEVTAYNELVNAIPLDIKNSIMFLEGLSNTELNSLYQNAACFVFPSFAEGFGIPPIEAAIHRCKVLCSNLTAMSEFSFFKYLYNPNDSLESDRLLVQILDDNNYPFDEIINEIRNRYNWNQIANTYAKHLLNMTKII